MMSPHLSVLQNQFPGAVLLHISDVADVLGTTYGSVRSQISTKKFPLKTIRRGSRRYVSIIALADYLDQLVESAPSPQRRRGRPRKADVQSRNVTK